MVCIRQGLVRNLNSMTVLIRNTPVSCHHINNTKTLSRTLQGIIIYFNSTKKYSKIAFAKALLLYFGKPNTCLN